MNKRIIALTYIFALLIPSCKAKNKIEYTFSTYVEEKMKSLNNHQELSECDDYISSFIQMGLYSKRISNDNNSFEYVCELASEKPIEINPSSLSGEEKDTYYQDIGNPISNTIYDIKLNKEAKFQNGREIKADEYILSLKDLLDPKYSNEKASLFTEEYQLINAKAYNEQNRYVLKSLYEILQDEADFIPSDGNYYLNVCKVNPFISKLFSGDVDASLYDLIYQSTFDKTSNISLYGQRIIDATIYYLAYSFIVHYDNISHDGTRRFEHEDEISSYLKFYNDNEDFYNQNYSAWKKLISIDKANIVENVTSTMLEDMPSINITEFDNHTLYVRQKANNSVIDSNNSEKYSYTSFISDMNNFVKAVSDLSTSSSYRVLLYANYKDATSVDFNSVGIKKIDDYTIRLYFKEKISTDNLMSLLTYNFLVDTDLYDRLTKVNAIRKVTEYQTGDIGNFNSYGPYKIETIEEDKLVLVKNENYQIKSDNLYKAEKVVIYYIDDKEKRNSMFFKGELDYIKNDDSLASYSNSSLLSKYSTNEIERIVLNSNYDSLISREKTNNKNILNNINFRKAISLAINRQEYCDNFSPSSRPLTTLYSDSYISNTYTGESYNLSSYGQSVLKTINTNLSSDDLKIEERDNGYSYTLAIDYMYKAITEELDSEKIASLKKGSTISLDVLIKNDSDSQTYVEKAQFLSKALNDILEVVNQKLLLVDKKINSDDEKIKLVINTILTSDYDTKIDSGSYDILFTTTKGNLNNPFSYMKYFASSKYTSCLEYGMRGKQNVEKIGVDLDDSGTIEEDEIKTYDDYFYMMNTTLSEDKFSLVSKDSSTYLNYLENHNKRLKILSSLECGILSRYETIPLISKTSSYFLSKKVSNYLLTAIPIFNYGGFEYLNFNYNDDEWSDYLKNNNYNLSQIYKN